MVDGLANGIKRFWIAEETGHADEQFVEQAVDLVGGFPQIPNVLDGIFELMDVHPALDAAPNGI